MSNLRGMRRIGDELFNFGQNIRLGGEFGKSPASGNNLLGGCELLNHFVSDEVMITFRETNRLVWIGTECL